MRKVINLQMEFLKKDIADIEFDLKSRDQIPKLLLGMHFIYRTAHIREKVFNVFKLIVPDSIMLISAKVNRFEEPGAG